MPRVRCLYEECIFIAKGFCTAGSIEIDPEDGCLTYSEDLSELNSNTEYGDEEDDKEDTWEDAGFEELEDADLKDEEY